MIDEHGGTMASKDDAHPTLILTVAQSGQVCGVVEASLALHEQFADDADSLTVETLWNKECAARIRASVSRALRTRASCSFESESEDGSVREFIFVPQGAAKVLLIMRDLTEQKRVHLDTQRLAYTDEITGLPNREFLLTELQKVVEVQRLKEGRSAVICIHVGHFDDYGYAVGATQQDKVLAQLAARLDGQLRGSNKQGAADFERYSIVSRSNYRQFCVVLPSIESGDDAEAVAERLVTELKLPVNMSNRTVIVNACGGIALYPQDGLDARSLFENALAAMEDARSEPDTAIRFHSGTVRLRTLQRTDLEAELKAALKNDDYDLDYLPVFDVNREAPIIMEALLRWPDAVLGSQPTRKIVRVAERTGLILPIGRWVLRQACERLRCWREAGHEDIRMAVNVSVQELVSDGLVEMVEQALSDFDIEPDALDIELKENWLSREAQSGFAISSRLEALGVRLVVDDYGTGPCSLADLAQSPISALKVDGSIIAGLETNDRDKAALAAALETANKLGLEAIAKGIETEKQACELRSLGYRYLQGFLLSKPMNAGAATEYLGVNATRGAGLRETNDGF
ncbi:MAG: EAL domain-containing protein [Woeseiaceae bacterium]|nr:EAL domain-containing protein [Woeseiaceae bacterium]